MGSHNAIRDIQVSCYIDPLDVLDLLIFLQLNPPSIRNSPLHSVRSPCMPLPQVPILPVSFAMISKFLCLLVLSVRGQLLDRDVQSANGPIFRQSARLDIAYSFCKHNWCRSTFTGELSWVIKRPKSGNHAGLGLLCSYICRFRLFQYDVAEWHTRHVSRVIHIFPFPRKPEHRLGAQIIDRLLQMQRSGRDNTQRCSRGQDGDRRRRCDSRLFH